MADDLEIAEQRVKRRKLNSLMTDFEHIFLIPLKSTVPIPLSKLFGSSSIQNTKNKRKLPHIVYDVYASLNNAEKEDVPSKKAKKRKQAKNELSSAQEKRRRKRKWEDALNQKYLASSTAEVLYVKNLSCSMIEVEENGDEAQEIEKIAGHERDQINEDTELHAIVGEQEVEEIAEHECTQRDEDIKSEFGNKESEDESGQNRFRLTEPERRGIDLLFGPSKAKRELLIQGIRHSQTQRCFNLKTKADEKNDDNMMDEQEQEDDAVNPVMKKCVDASDSENEDSDDSTITSSTESSESSDPTIGTVTESSVIDEDEFDADEKLIDEDKSNVEVTEALNNDISWDSLCSPISEEEGSVFETFDDEEDSIIPDEVNSSSMTSQISMELSFSSLIYDSSENSGSRKEIKAQEKVVDEEKISEEPVHVFSSEQNQESSADSDASNSLSPKQLDQMKENSDEDEDMSDVISIMADTEWADDFSGNEDEQSTKSRLRNLYGQAQIRPSVTKKVECKHESLDILTHEVEQKKIKDEETEDLEKPHYDSDESSSCIESYRRMTVERPSEPKPHFGVEKPDKRGSIRDRLTLPPVPLMLIKVQEPKQVPELQKSEGQKGSVFSRLQRKPFSAQRIFEGQCYSQLYKNKCLKKDCIYCPRTPRKEIRELEFYPVDLIIKVLEKAIEMKFDHFILTTYHQLINKLNYKDALQIFNKICCTKFIENSLVIENTLTIFQSKAISLHKCVADILDEAKDFPILVQKILNILEVKHVKTGNFWEALRMYFWRIRRADSNQLANIIHECVESEKEDSYIIEICEFLKFLKFKAKYNLHFIVNHKMRFIEMLKKRGFCQFLNIFDVQEDVVEVVDMEISEESLDEPPIVQNGQMKIPKEEDKNFPENDKLLEKTKKTVKNEPEKCESAMISRENPQEISVFMKNNRCENHIAREQIQVAQPHLQNAQTLNGLPHFQDSQQFPVNNNNYPLRPKITSFAPPAGNSNCPLIVNQDTIYHQFVVHSDLQPEKTLISKRDPRIYRNKPWNLVPLGYIPPTQIRLESDKFKNLFQELQTLRGCLFTKNFEEVFKILLKCKEQSKSSYNKCWDLINSYALERSLLNLGSSTMTSTERMFWTYVADFKKFKEYLNYSMYGRALEIFSFYLEKAWSEPQSLFAGACKVLRKEGNGVIQFS